MRSPTKPLFWMAIVALIGCTLALLPGLDAAEKKPKNRGEKRRRPLENAVSSPNTEANLAQKKDAEKRKLLMDAAKAAMIRLQAAKVKEDAERSGNPASETEPAPSIQAINKTSENSIGGTVRHGGIPYHPLPKQGSDLPQDIREHVQTVFLRVESPVNAAQPVDPIAQEPATLPEAHAAHLEKRVDQIEQKLDEVLTLLKSQPPRLLKKKK